MAYTDLTKGGIWKKLIVFSAPMVLSSVLQAMYSITDMIIVGRFVGSAGISAVTNSGQIMNMLMQILMGITIGGNVLIGQRFGAKDKAGTADATVTLFTLSLMMGAGLTVLFLAFSRSALVVLGAPALGEATAYLRICSTGILFIIGYNACSSALRAVGNSKAPLIAIACTSVLNIILDLLLVGLLKMEVRGAALATVISQGVSFAIALIFVLKERDIFGLRLRALYMRREEVRLIFKYGIPCAVQMSVASISWLSVTYLINGYGVYISAGYGVSMRIKDFCQLFIAAMSTAASSMIAQCIGARDYERARKVTYTAMKITLGMAAVLIVVVEVWAPQLCAIFTDEPLALQAAVKNLRIEIIGQIFYASFLIYHALAIGAGHTWFAFFSSFLNCIVVRLILAMILNALFGVTGLYLACMIAPFSSVPLGLWYERSNRWQKLRV